jgi:hypothetical protein
MAITNPTDVAWLGHRLGVYLRNHGQTAEVWCDRVQEAEPTLTKPTEDAYELGNVSKVGVTQQPGEFRFVVRANLHSNEIDSILANGTGSPGSQFTLGDMINNTAVRACVVARHIGDTNPSYEWIYDSNTLAEASWDFVIGGPCTSSFTLEGKSGNAYTSGSLTHTTWGAFNTVSPGSVNGKDARVYFTTSDNRGYRLQRFNIRATFPVQTVRELGNRALVGKLADTPNVTCEFDILLADHQPIQELFDISGTGYDLNSPKTLDVWVTVFDPTAAEAVTGIKYMKLENCIVTGGTPGRGVVRGLATARYTLTVQKATTANSAGLIISPSSIS